MIVAPSASLGYGVTKMDGVVIEECDSMTCNHCNAIQWVKCWPPTADEAGFCRSCMRYICVGCDARSLRCVVFEQRIAAYEQRMRLFQAVGI